MRSLLFHQEAKLKRLARIKSKDYHRRALRGAKAKTRVRLCEKRACPAPPHGSAGPACVS
jgi:U3 small nucleolar RNA-associated protein 14